MIDRDPHGIEQHAPGAKLDAGKNRLGLIMTGFARALVAVGQVGTYGASKYTPHGWRSVPNGVDRYTDAMYRHLLAEASGQPIDDESGLLHAAQAAWNALARLELMLSPPDEALNRQRAVMLGSLGSPFTPADPQSPPAPGCSTSSGS